MSCHLPLWYIPLVFIPNGPVEYIKANLIEYRVPSMIFSALPLEGSTVEKMLDAAYLLVGTLEKKLDFPLLWYQLGITK